MLETIITIVYVAVAIFMVLAILVQSGKGGGLGSALGGGASQAVFGGGGGADFVAKLTQVFAATFMISAMYLAYVGAHTGSDFLRQRSQELESSARLASTEGDVDYEMVGLGRPQRLPTAAESEAFQASQEGAPIEEPPAEEPPPEEPPADGATTGEAVPADGDDTAEGEDPPAKDTAPPGDEVEEPPAEPTPSDETDVVAG